MQTSGIESQPFADQRVDLIRAAVVHEGEVDEDWRVRRCPSDCVVQQQPFFHQVFALQELQTDLRVQLRELLGFFEEVSRVDDVRPAVRQVSRVILALSDRRVEVEVLVGQQLSRVLSAEADLLDFEVALVCLGLQIVAVVRKL